MTSDPSSADARPAPRPSPARWSVVAAHTVPLLVLPSGVWRILLGSGVAMGASRSSLAADDMPGRGTVTMVLLSLVAEAAALFSLGLVHRWGETVPRWVPLLGGRRIPPYAVVVPAVTGGVVLTGVWAYWVRHTDHRPTAHPSRPADPRPAPPDPRTAEPEDSLP